MNDVTQNGNCTFVGGAYTNDLRTEMMPFDAGMDPIQAQWRDTMQAEFRRLIDAMPGVGMVLFLFGEHAGKGRLNYIANVKREEAIPAMQEWIDIQRTMQKMSVADLSEAALDESCVDLFAIALKAKLASMRDIRQPGWLDDPVDEFRLEAFDGVTNSDWLKVGLCAMAAYLKDRGVEK